MFLTLLIFLQGQSLSKALPKKRFYPLISSEGAKAANATLQDA